MQRQEKGFPPATEPVERKPGRAGACAAKYFDIAAKVVKIDGAGGSPPVKLHILPSSAILTAAPGRIGQH